MNSIQVKVKGTLPGFPVGQVVTVITDEHGTPLLEYWRRRLKDANIDGCVEVVLPDNTADLPPGYLERLEKLPKSKQPSKSQQRRLEIQKRKKT